MKEIKNLKIGHCKLILKNSITYSELCNFIFICECLLYLTSCSRYGKLENQLSKNPENNLSALDNRNIIDEQQKILSDSLMGLACNVDVNLDCQPQRSSLPQTWNISTPLSEQKLRRIALYLSNEVQGSTNSCEKFALLLKTECNIKEPVVRMFYAHPSKLLKPIWYYQTIS